MSSDGFAVDPAALGAVRDRLGDMAEELAAPAHETPSGDVFGHSRLAEAITEFTAKEQDSRAELAAEVDSIRDRLAKTVEAYWRAERDGASRFGGIEP